MTARRVLAATVAACVPLAVLTLTSPGGSGWAIWLALTLLTGLTLADHTDRTTP